jgi:hypothetical protein
MFNSSCTNRYYNTKGKRKGNGLAGGVLQQCAQIRRVGLQKGCAH